MKDGGAAPERGLEDVISRALRDNLAPLQRTADEMQQAYADLVAACGSSRPNNALSALLRAQTAASSLASGLSVLSNFLVIAVKPFDGPLSQPASSHATTAVAEPEAPPVPSHPAGGAQRLAATSAEEIRQAPSRPGEIPLEETPVSSYMEEIPLEAEAEVRGPASAEPESAGGLRAVPEREPVFDLSSFPADIQDLHRRANRVAKVAMQDIKLLRPKDVQLGRENKDLCDRLRSDLDKARKEYDRRFRAIQDHPVDYFHRWVLEILAEGNEEALGEYPYPSPVLRH